MVQTNRRTKSSHLSFNHSMWRSCSRDQGMIKHTHVVFKLYRPVTNRPHHSRCHTPPLPSLPVTHSTAATLCGELVLIGGKWDRSPVNSIHQLVEGQWVEIGSIMACSRNYSIYSSKYITTEVHHGGWIKSLSHKQGRVEECVVV